MTHVYSTIGVPPAEQKLTRSRKRLTSWFACGPPDDRWPREVFRGRRPGTWLVCVTRPKKGQGSVHYDSLQPGKSQWYHVREVAA